MNKILLSFVTVVSLFSVSAFAMDDPECKEVEAKKSEELSAQLGLPVGPNSTINEK